MFISTNNVKRGEILQYNICIIGAGAAGITLARTLKDVDINIALLESGDRKPDTKISELNEIETLGLPLSEPSRARVFGGTTSVWAGRWKDHDPFDFEKKEWVPYSGWPITYEDIKPYYKMAADVLHAPGLSTLSMDTVSNDETIFSNDAIETTIFTWLKKQDWHWGEKFQDEFASSKNIDVYLQATVTKLETDQSGRNITSAIIQTTEGNQCVLRAKQFILASGGLENPRLLLLSKSKQWPDGLGNTYDQVGRYYMDHPKGVVGEIIPENKNMYLPLYWGTTVNSLFSRAGLALTKQIQRAEKTLNSYVLLEPVFPWSYNPGLSAAIALAQKLKKRQIPNDIIVQYISEIAHNQKTVAKWMYAKVINKLFNKQAAVEKITIWNFMEQAPNPQNRVSLARTNDRLGNPKVELKWSIYDIDKHTMKVMHAKLKELCAEQHIGSLKSPLLDNPESDWPISNDASHHMGTTRMGTDPKTSVVNEQCRVHGLDNLFVAGSSVFPTGGYANPTFTICALAARLADQLRQDYAKK